MERGIPWRRAAWFGALALATACSSKVEVTTVPSEPRVVNFQYKGGGGDFEFVTVNGRPQGIGEDLLAPDEHYFGTVDGKVIAHKDGVLRVGEQRFPTLPMTANVEILGAQVLVNGELWGTIEGE